MYCKILLRAKLTTFFFGFTQHNKPKRREAENHKPVNLERSPLTNLLIYMYIYIHDQLVANARMMRANIQYVLLVSVVVFLKSAI
jgi:hypothetical protein